MEENTQNNGTMPQKEDNTIAIISYLTIIGWIIAVIMYTNKKSELAAYHLRDMFGLILTSLVLWIIGFIPFIGYIIYLLGLILLFVLWLIGLINAINGVKKPLPIIGDLFQKWFATMFV
jgi:uncharacterized membrane protein